MKKIKKEIIVVPMQYKKRNFELQFEKEKIHLSYSYMFYIKAVNYGVKSGGYGVPVENCDSLDDFINQVMGNREFLKELLDFYIDEHCVRSCV